MLHYLTATLRFRITQVTQSHSVHDLLVIGGGINGAGIAADAAGRGLNVVLCEKSDLAGATSSSSSKLIHGGLRYLEFYEFKMVRKSLHGLRSFVRGIRRIVRIGFCHVVSIWLLSPNL